MTNTTKLSTADQILATLGADALKRWGAADILKTASSVRFRVAGAKDGITHVVIGDESAYKQDHWLVFFMHVDALGRQRVLSTIGPIYWDNVNSAITHATGLAWF